MQETWIFDLQQTDEEPRDYAVVLPNLIRQKSKEMGIFLSYYFRNEGGLVEEVQLKDISFTNSTSGELKVDFKVIHYNACLNINSNDKEEMDLNFIFIPSEGIVKLTGPFWPQREPDGI